MAVLALAGCGGGDDSTTEAESPAGDPAPTATAKKQDGAPERQSSGRSSAADEGNSPARRSKAESPAKPGKGAKEQKAGGDAGGNRAPAAGDGDRVGSVGSGRCPGNITRAQCKAYAQLPESNAPSHAVNEPGACEQTMSRVACEEMFETERADDTGSSVSVERCLEERTRAQCEAQLQPSLEAERERSGDG